MQRISDDDLEKIVPTVVSIAELMRKIGRAPTGGNCTHYSKRIKKLGISTEHFQPVFSKGKPSPFKRDIANTLQMMPEGSSREKRKHLLAAMLQCGVEYQCNMCNISKWLGNEITLDIDHIDGNYLNNNIDNLRFLCPNCHSQTANFAGKNKKGR